MLFDRLLSNRAGDEGRDVGRGRGSVEGGDGPDGARVKRILKLIDWEVVLLMACRLSVPHTQHPYLILPLPLPPPLSLSLSLSLSLPPSLSLSLSLSLSFPLMATGRLAAVYHLEKCARW